MRAASNQIEVSGLLELVAFGAVAGWERVFADCIAGRLPRHGAPVTGQAASPAAAPAEETPAAQEATAEAAAPAASIDMALAAEGENVFKKCKACHQVGEDASNRVGPQLNGIVGRAAGTVDGFKYSSALEEAAAGGLVWDPESLAAFLEKPKDFMKGTKMSFAGLRKEDERANVIAYLATFDN